MFIAAAYINSNNFIYLHSHIDGIAEKEKKVI